MSGLTLSSEATMRTRAVIDRTRKLLAALSENYPDIGADSRVARLRKDLESVGGVLQSSGGVEARSDREYVDGEPYAVAEVCCRDSDWECSCGARGTSLADLATIGSCALTPGDPSPAGRCPDCQSLVYPQGVSS